jgi:hypothetical protein
MSSVVDATHRLHQNPARPETAVPVPQSRLPVIARHARLGLGKPRCQSTFRNAVDRASLPLDCELSTEGNIGLNRFAVSVGTALTVVSLHSTPQQEDGQAYRPLTLRFRMI